MTSKRFEFIRDHHGASQEGCNNGGISLYKDRETGNRVNLKNFSAESCTKGIAKREIRILASLRHPNVTRLVDYQLSKHSARAGMYLEYCDQGDLDLLIKRNRHSGKRVDEAYMWHIFESLAAAVQCCHEGPRSARGGGGGGGGWEWCIHRDIKPGNVLLSSTTQDGVPLPRDHDFAFPRVVLADFGQAMERSRYEYEARRNPHEANLLNDRIDRQCRTPEMPYYGVYTDIYQVGLVMYCLAHLVLDAGNTMERVPSSVFKGIARESVGRRYSEPLNRIVRRCLDMDPESRPSAGELLASIMRNRPRA